MGAFLSSIGNIISTAATFVIHTLQSIATLFGAIISTVVFTSNVISVLPVSIALFATAFVGIMVIYVVVGR